MRTEIMLSIAALLLMIAPASRAASEHEEEVSLEQVPQVVKATIQKEAAGAKIIEVEREIRLGRTIYEAEFIRDGKEIEIEVALDGTLIKTETEDDEFEEPIAFEEIPDNAKAALKQLAGEATIIEAEMEKENGILTYEARWKIGETRHEAKVLPDGTLVEMEKSIAITDLPEPVLAEVYKYFGKDTKVEVEKKMVVVYEIDAKVNGKHKELLVLTTGCVIDDDHRD